MKKKMLREIEARLGEGYKAEEHEVKKNNGIVLHGIVVHKEGENIAPQIYIDDVPEDEVVDYVVDKYNEVKDNKSGMYPDIDEVRRKIMTKEGLLENVVPVLVNREKNEAKLKEIVHRPFLDMEITFKIDMGNSGFVTIDNKLLKNVGISDEELYDAAMENVQGCGETVELSSLVPEFMREAAGKDMPPVLLLTNEEKLLGAGMIFDKEAIEKLVEDIGDFFILPSSIHEVLIVPVKCGKAKALRKMVQDVNTMLDERDYLSDNVYICKNGEIEVA